VRTPATVSGLLLVGTTQTSLHDCDAVVWQGLDSVARPLGAQIIQLTV